MSDVPDYFTHKRTKKVHSKISRDEMKRAQNSTCKSETAIPYEVGGEKHGNFGILMRGTDCVKALSEYFVP